MVAAPGRPGRRPVAVAELAMAQLIYAAGRLTGSNGSEVSLGSNARAGGRAILAQAPVGSSSGGGSAPQRMA